MWCLTCDGASAQTLSARALHQVALLALTEINDVQRLPSDNFVPQKVLVAQRQPVVIVVHGKWALAHNRGTAPQEDGEWRTMATKRMAVTAMAIMAVLCC